MTAERGPVDTCRSGMLSSPLRRRAGQSGTASSSTSPEPEALESFLSELQHLRERMAGLLTVADALSDPAASPAWRALVLEMRAGHRRAEHLLEAAAQHDAIDLPAPGIASPDRPVSKAALLAHCRRLARDLEEQCAAASGHAGALGLAALAGALQRWRCELIGLERPLIAAHAEAQHAREA